MACVMALHSDPSVAYLGAFIFVALAALFDFLDGLSARLLKAYSNVGKELDSLSDVVSFGVAPGCIVYAYLSTISDNIPYGNELSFLAFLLPVFAALRLAKFNVDTRQSTSFLGLPVPANGLFWAAFIPSILADTEKQPLLFAGIVVFLILVFCFLMVSEIPMFSLKFKHLKWKGNEWSFSLIILSVLLVAIFLFTGTPLLSVGLIIVSYIVMSLIKK
jgi:CDP-diacylglycerol--serine O-phosphatidyltransferase